MDMKISIASDHAGFDQKQQLAAFLREQGHEVFDRGPENDDRVDYPDYAELVAHDVVDGVAERGVLVCGTGIGMAIAEILKTFLSTDFGGGRHAGRVEKIMALESK